mmetsp:Transcript_22574/g.35312  ORF Transcript_22574/g.35312 Transcript_22574/m.35312 type:complete len:113 (-) Transcript_22574:202-540(-)
MSMREKTKHKKFLGILAVSKSSSPEILTQHPRLFRATQIAAIDIDDEEDCPVRGACLKLSFHRRNALNVLSSAETELCVCCTSREERCKWFDALRHWHARHLDCSFGGRVME